VVYNLRLYGDCGGPTSIPHTVTIHLSLSHFTYLFMYLYVAHDEIDTISVGPLFALT